MSGIDEFRRIGVLAVELAPVFARKIGAQTDYASRMS